MDVEYRDHPPAQDDLLQLYGSVGWTAYTSNPERLSRGVHGSGWVRAAWVGDRLVGLCRAVTDGATICYLQDVLVDPEFHRHGIGRALVQGCLDAHSDVRQFVLMTDDRPEQLAFYRSLGLACIADLEKVKLNAFIRFAGATVE